MISALCYSWFRVGNALQKNIQEENILLSFFLVSSSPSRLLEAMKPDWNNAVEKTAEEKIRWLQLSLTLSDIFPFQNELNEQIKRAQFCLSFLQQPELFLRIRPQHKTGVIEKMKAAGSTYFLHNDNETLQLPPATKIESMLDIDREVVVQDFNSQQVLNYIKMNPSLMKGSIRAWDCCAASGGKSLLLYDILGGNVQLTVSDIRQTIIYNLQQRFTRAGIRHYDHFVADATNDETKVAGGNYNIIICDAPCTGSGTWSRTPEQLYFFNDASIEEYAIRQKKIVTNVIGYLKKNGLFFYITCSVFKKENEEVVEHILQEHAVQLLEMKYLYGYKINADSMFVAVFKRSA